MDANPPLSDHLQVTSWMSWLHLRRQVSQLGTQTLQWPLQGSPKSTGQTCYMVSLGKERDRQRWDSTERCMVLRSGPGGRGPSPTIPLSRAARGLTILSVQPNRKVFSGLNMTLLCCSWRLRDTFHLVSDEAAQILMLLREKYQAELLQAEFSMSPVPSPHRGPTGTIVQTTSPAPCCHSPVKPCSTRSEGGLDL